MAAALARLTTGRTTFVITHDLAAARGAERVVWLEEGRVRHDGPPEAVLPPATPDDEGITSTAAARGTPGTEVTVGADR